MKFKVQPPTTIDIYARHDAPYSAMITEKYGHDTKTRWTRAFPTGFAVDKYVRELMEEDDGVIAVSVWTETGKYFVTTYTRGPNANPDDDVQNRRPNRKIVRPR